jgi:hypothetical protein
MISHNLLRHLQMREWEAVDHLQGWDNRIKEVEDMVRLQVLIKWVHLLQT